MSLSGASGSAAGYADLILKIAMFVSSVYNMINMFLLRNITCHVLLFGAKIFFMMMLMMYYLDKHIYDIMLFLLASILWNKLNMNLPNFLTVAMAADPRSVQGPEEEDGKKQETESPLSTVPIDRVSPS